MTRLGNPLGWRFMVLSLALLAPSLAWAQGRTIRFDEEVIKGKVQKPEVSILITRQNLNDNYTLELKESFLPKIYESVEDQPF